MIASLWYFLLFTGLFYLIYKAVFARYSFFRLNRIYLLAVPLISLLIAFLAPRFALPWPQTATVNFTLPEITIEGTNITKVSLLTPEQEEALPWIYWLGVALFALYFLGGIYKLFLLLRSAQPDEQGLIITDKAYQAFNFGPYVVIPQRLSDHSDLPLIIEHEMLHRRLYHGWDNLYYNLWGIFAWFNPFLPLLARELKQSHECEVDAGVVADNDPEDYAHLLLSSTLGGDISYPSSALTASPFIYSSFIKTRITMMYKNQTPQWRRVVYLTILPLMAGMTLLACNKSEEANRQEVKMEVLNANEVEAFPLAEGCEEANRQNCFMQSVTKHVSENFTYPKSVEQLGMEGKVYVQFVIDANGSVAEVTVARGLEANTPEEEAAAKEADAQMITLMQSLPQYEEGAIKDGEPVAMRFTLPVQFKLESKA